MTTSQTEIKSQVIESATGAFKAFCDEFSGMCGLDIQCEQQEAGTETIAGLEERFGRLVAVNIVESQGLLNGTFRIIFDRDGLFTVGGIIAELLEDKIAANRNEGSNELAESMVDALGEAGNLMVGSLDRAFKEEIEGHGQFVQRLPAFVGEPWDQPEEKIGLAGDTECVFIPCRMTVGSFGAFRCGVIFPNAFFAGDSELENDADSSAEENDQEQSQDPQAEEQTAEPQAAESEQEDGGEVTQPQEPDAEAAPAEEASAPEDAEQADIEQKQEEEKDSLEKADSAEHEAEVTGEESHPADNEDNAADIAEEEVSVSETVEQTAGGKVSEAIRQMAGSSAALPGEPDEHETKQTDVIAGTGELLSTCAKDIMQKDIVWADPEESVQQAHAKMQQHDAGYLMVGKDGVLEGIVSKSDISGALSPYLRPIFSKWRRSLDDATLKIRTKWIMSRPVRTVTPEKPLAVVIDNICRFGGGALPVVDEQGKVRGLVTAFEIFQKLLNTESDVSTAGKTRQGPPLA